VQFCNVHVEEILLAIGVDPLITVITVLATSRSTVAELESDPDGIRKCKTLFAIDPAVDVHLRIALTVLIMGGNGTRGDVTRYS
jgi:hypothetical protein